MSFSGIKTAVINVAHRCQQTGQELDKAGLAASLCRAVSESLVGRTMAAAKALGYGKIAVAGGVAANSRIRADFEAACRRDGCTLYVPPLKLCGDNGAMIGAQGYYEYQAGHVADSSLNAYATLELAGEPRV
jgi:N6-L-threonylcarbamoyladenine synthase